MRVPGPAVVHRAPQLKDVEVYGFVGWIGTALAYVIFLLWAYLPERTLHELGITYYPHKSWALIIPAWLIVVYILSGWVYVGLNFLITAPLESMETVTDSWSKRAVGGKGLMMTGQDGGVGMGGSSARLRQHMHGLQQTSRGEKSGKGGGDGLGVGGVPTFADINVGVVNYLLYMAKPSDGDGGQGTSAGGNSTRGSGGQSPSRGPWGRHSGVKARLSTGVHKRRGSLLFPGGGSAGGIGSGLTTEL